jgi:segregation and condensation protein A
METISYKLPDFEGPLDLLLFLVQKNKLNIYDISLTVLIDQYLQQMEDFKAQDMEIQSEFLEMASRLIYMKTVSLLPKHEEVEELKAELTGELLEYQVCKTVAATLATMTDGFNRFVREPAPVEVDKTYVLKHDKQVMFDAYIAAVGRGQRRLPPSTAPFTRIVAKKIVAVSTKIVYVIRSLWSGNKKRLADLYKTAQSRSEMVATFLAVLELCKANRVFVEGDGENQQISLKKERKNK